jgi:hypothetical protein
MDRFLSEMKSRLMLAHWMG